MPNPFLLLIPAIDRLEITIWLVPLLIGNALVVSVVGLLLGPMYPICMDKARKVFLDGVLAGSIGALATVHVRALTRMLPWVG